MTPERLTDKPFNPFETYERIDSDSFIEAKYNGSLKGEVVASGTKNMVSKVIAAALSCDNSNVQIENIPFVGDLDITLQLCRSLGLTYSVSRDKKLTLNIEDLKNYEVISNSEQGNRVAILLAGPVLSKIGRAVISKPGGCNIGERKIDYHLRGLESFGVNIIEKQDSYELDLKDGRRLHPSHFKLPFPSVGATENLLITASCAEGESVLENCALEPEIIELIKILQMSGVIIKTFAPNSLSIIGGKHSLDGPVRIIPDRVEIASLAIAALTTKGDVFIKDAQHEPLINFIGCVQEMGGGVEIKSEGIRFYYKEQLKPINITTQVYPGFPTDFQQPMAILMSQANGKSIIHETIFENRFLYFSELNKISENRHSFFVDDQCLETDPCRYQNLKYPHLAQINGPVAFRKGEIEITDLRAGFAALNAAILSDGVIIKNLKSLYRGYEDPVGKLKSLGAEIDIRV